MQITPLTWKTIGQQDNFSCFTIGCNQRAEYVVKIKRGDLVIQVCLCGKCLRHGPSTILQKIQESNSGLKTTDMDQPKNPGWETGHAV